MINHPQTQLAAITRYCVERGIALDVREDGWLLVLDDAPRRHLIFGYDLGLNSAVAHRLACDKAATASLLAASGVPAVPHAFFLAPAQGGGSSRAADAMPALLAAHPRGVVIKPNEGTSGRAVTRARTRADALRAIGRIFETGANVAIAPLLDIEDEVRIVQLDDVALIAYRKLRPAVTGDGAASLRELALAAAPAAEHGQLLRRLDAEFDASELNDVVPHGERRLLSWRHNLEFGAKPVLLDHGKLRDTCTALAVDAARTIGIRYASIDVVLVDGLWQVLEINSGVKMEALGRHAPELVERTYFAALDRIFGCRPSR
ncbi:MULTISPECIES: RimK-like protein [unclassified Bradyrhizobium]|uniref:ATP-grasp domain-containing protein n=1 Tax=unclassified Bradyrhizobium TaxID=2631580 RepID=UPI0028EF82A0|nr:MULTISPECIES: RimK-like protein [unclassified Bradyrhizobium]